MALDASAGGVGARRKPGEGREPAFFARVGICRRRVLGFRVEGLGFNLGFRV